VNAQAWVPHSSAKAAMSADKADKIGVLVRNDAEMAAGTKSLSR
jgi:hypothetical protein